MPSDSGTSHKAELISWSSLQTHSVDAVNKPEVVSAFTFITDLLLNQLDTTKWSQPAAAAAGKSSTDWQVLLLMWNVQSLIMNQRWSDVLFLETLESLDEERPFLSFRFRTAVTTELNITSSVVDDETTRVLLFFYRLLLLSFLFLYLFTGSDSAEFKWQQWKKKKKLTVLCCRTLKKKKSGVTQLLKTQSLKNFIVETTSALLSYITWMKQQRTSLEAVKVSLPETDKLNEGKEYCTTSDTSYTMCPQHTLPWHVYSLFISTVFHSSELYRLIACV